MSKTTLIKAKMESLKWTEKQRMSWLLTMFGTSIFEKLSEQQKVLAMTALEANLAVMRNA